MNQTALIESMNNVLANTYALYLKTQNYHWNVEGASFKSLHALFEEQYTDLALAVDTAAELIRGLGAKAPGTFEAYMKRSSVRSGNESASAEQMLSELFEDQNQMQKILQSTLEIAQQCGDEVVAGFVIERLTVHRKAAWMMKSSL